MEIPSSIASNLHFLQVEIDSLVEKLQVFFGDVGKGNAKDILSREGYIQNLKQRIHNSCLQHLTQFEPGHPQITALRSIEEIASQLEDIGTLAIGCVSHIERMAAPEVLRPTLYVPMLQHIRDALEMLEPAISDNKSRRALRITRFEGRLEQDCNKLKKRYIQALKNNKKQTEDLAQALFVSQSVASMGDALVNISEAIISANVGQTVSLERYRSLQSSVEKLQRQQKVDDVKIETIAETRSGSAIAGVSSGKETDQSYLGIFKDGEKKKVKEEREGVKSWHDIYPGLAPRILSYDKRGQSAALLIEHLPGLTFEKLALQADDNLFAQAHDRLVETLNKVWRETLIKEPVTADFGGQLKRRIDPVYKIHPEFNRAPSRINALRLPAFDTLIEQATELEAKLAAPFSVYIHGDFNIDNIIYDPASQKINFIDLHRSRYMDYVQDVSVFMVSNYRLQILDTPVRRRLMQSALRIHETASAFAREQDDTSFDLRMALALARSFASSTRFILDKAHAKGMFFRARYLLEQALAANPQKPEKFTLTVREMFIA